MDDNLKLHLKLKLSLAQLSPSLLSLFLYNLLSLKLRLHKHVIIANIAKLRQSSTSTELGWGLVLFLNSPTHPTLNSKDYTFQEAEIRHASSNVPN